FYCYWSPVTVFYPLTLLDALPISASTRSPTSTIVTPSGIPTWAATSAIDRGSQHAFAIRACSNDKRCAADATVCTIVSMRSESRSEEHTSELQSRETIVCCLLLEK